MLLVLPASRESSSLEQRITKETYNCVMHGLGGSINTTNIWSVPISGPKGRERKTVTFSLPSARNLGQELLSSLLYWGVKGRQPCVTFIIFCIFLCDTIL